MENRIQQLRRELELYRGYLRKGVLSQQADDYMRRILEITKELERLEAEAGSGP